MDFVITAGINAAIEKNPGTLEAIKQAVEQFNNCNWGKVPEEDKEANNADLAANTGRILARYETPEGDIYINAYPGTDEPAVIMFCYEY